MNSHCLPSRCKLNKLCHHSEICNFIAMNVECIIQLKYQIIFHLTPSATCLPICRHPGSLYNYYCILIIRQDTTICPCLFNLTASLKLVFLPLAPWIEAKGPLISNLMKKTRSRTLLQSARRQPSLPSHKIRFQKWIRLWIKLNTNDHIWESIWE